jgi:hypothetical protein
MPFRRVVAAGLALAAGALIVKAAAGSRSAPRDTRFSSHRYAYALIVPAGWTAHALGARRRARPPARSTAHRPPSTHCRPHAEQGGRGSTTSSPMPATDTTSRKTHSPPNKPNTAAFSHKSSGHSRLPDSCPARVTVRNTRPAVAATTEAIGRPSRRKRTASASLESGAFAFRTAVAGNARPQTIRAVRRHPAAHHDYTKPLCKPEVIGSIPIRSMGD